VTATYAGATHAVGTFTGTTPSYLVNDNDSLQAGIPFTDSDYLTRRRVALLGVTVATDLVGGDGLSVVGKTIQFNGISYQVLGVLTTKGSTGPEDQDDRVIAPLTAVQDTLTGYGPLSSVSVKAASADAVPAAQAEVEDVLERTVDTARVAASSGLRAPYIPAWYVVGSGGGAGSTAGITFA
jgi:putative ABC transport system permease protein